MISVPNVLKTFVHIYSSSGLFYADDLSIEAKIDLSSTIFCLFSNKPPSLNCAKVVITQGFRSKDNSS